MAVASKVPERNQAHRKSELACLVRHGSKIMTCKRVVFYSRLVVIEEHFGYRCEED